MQMSNEQDYRQVGHLFTSSDLIIDSDLGIFSTSGLNSYYTAINNHIQWLQTVGLPPKLMYTYPIQMGSHDVSSGRGPMNDEPDRRPPHQLVQCTQLTGQQI